MASRIVPGRIGKQSRLGMRKLLYGPHEVQLSDEEDLSNLTQQIVTAAKQPNDRFIVVVDDRDATWSLLLTPGVAVAVVEAPELEGPTYD